MITSSCTQPAEGFSAGILICRWGRASDWQLISGAFELHHDMALQHMDAYLAWVWTLAEYDLGIELVFI